MHDIDARKFQSASQTATLKMRETHGSVFLTIALCNPVFRYTLFFSIRICFLRILRLTFVKF